MAPDGRSTSGLLRTLRLLRWPGIALLALMLLARLALGPAARSTLEEALDETLRPEVSLRKVKLRLVAGSMEIQQLAIGNPEGFGSTDVVVFPRVEVGTGLHEFLEEKVTLRDVMIHDPYVFLEMGPEGINLVALTEELRSRIAERKTPGSTEAGARTVEGAAGKRFKVNEGVFRDLRIRYVESEQPVRVPRSSFRITERWYTLDEILERILTEVVEALLRHADRQRLPPELFRDLEWSLRDPESR